MARQDQWDEEAEVVVAEGEELVEGPPRAGAGDPAVHRDGSAPGSKDRQGAGVQDGSQDGQGAGLPGPVL